MALVFDNRNNLQGQPGFHALIAGVSRYKHLPGGGGAPAKEDWGLVQLTATALTAYKIYSWLIKHRHQLPKKLATVRLLLSPSDAEAQKITEGMAEIRQALKDEPVTLQDVASPCTLDNFTAEALRWRDDAGSNNGEDNMTFFYFAGHGIQRKNNDPVLLPEDFGNPHAPILRNAATFNSLFDGMVPPADPQRKIAATQLYFVDACRVIPPELIRYQLPNIADILDAELGGVDNRSAPIFYGTVSNTKAYAKSGQQTLFSEALIECLEGYGGEGEQGVEGDKWYVSINSLSAALNAKVAGLKALGIDQEYYPTQRGQDATIVNLDGPPQVKCILEVEPEKAIPFVTVKLKDASDEQGDAIWTLSPVNPHPYHGQLRAGFYALEAKVTGAPQPQYVDSPRRIVPVRPLKGERLKVKVGA